MLPVILALLLAGCSSPASSGKPKEVRGLPYPLYITHNHRNVQQQGQAHLMLFPSLSFHNALAPFPSKLRGKVPNDSDVAQFRLAKSAPEFPFSTGPSFSSQIISVYSNSYSGNSYQVATLVGTNCWQLKYTSAHRQVQYGLTTLKGMPQTQLIVNCMASITPGSGWQTSWPAASASDPPAHPIPPPPQAHN